MAKPGGRSKKHRSLRHIVDGGELTVDRLSQHHLPDHFRRADPQFIGLLQD